MNYERPQIEMVRKRLAEAPRFMTVVSGPRQVGKTTLVRQVLAGMPSHFVSADEPVPSDPEDWSATPGSEPYRELPGQAPTEEWLVRHWLRARANAARLPGNQHYVLAIDEVQKIPRWSEIVKGLWDADRANSTRLHVILLGSSPWLMQRGLTESLAGRFEPIPLGHWSYPEMDAAFDFSLEAFVYFGGYPGCAPFVQDEPRWRTYVRGALIDPSIERDILQMTRVDKPALLKALFELGCGGYSGQVISYTKLQGQLQDAGNTVTLAHYLDLLSQAGLLTGLQKYAGHKHRQRASSPKLHAQNTALVSALAGYSFTEARSDRSFWGRLVESAAGAHLINSASADCTVHYWRESPHEVDFVLCRGRKLLAIEIKSGPNPRPNRGLEIFATSFPGARTLTVGEGGVPLAEFLSQPADAWLE